MKIFKNSVTKIIVASLIFPVTLTILGLILSKQSDNNFAQILADLVIFLVAYLLNRKYFQEEIFWFNQKNGMSQLSTAFPALIIIAFLNSPVLLVNDFQVKFKVILLCLLVGLAEEYIFRGLLIGLFLKANHNNAFGAVVGSSILFGLIHITNLRALPFGYVASQMIFAAAIGILFGTIYIKTHNLAIVIALHAFRDMFPMFSEKLMKQASQTTFTMASLYVMIVFLMIALVISYMQLQNFDIKKAE